MDNLTIALLIWSAITIIILYTAYKSVKKELEIVKDVDNKSFYRIWKDAQLKLCKMDDEITELKRQLHNMTCNRNYYKTERNDLQDLLLNYEWEEETLDKLDLLTNNKKWKLEK